MVCVDVHGLLQKKNMVCVDVHYTAYFDNIFS